MIKFFRKIRHTLLSQNKLSKYLIYAIGEILLVVLGILIALSINNANEIRKNDTKINNILIEIQKDLVKDITNSVRVFDDFMWADSIQDLILNDKYTYEDYKESRTQRLSLSYADFVVQPNGYENLMRNIDNVPEELRYLLADLKYLYIDVKSDINVYNTRIRKTVYDNLDFLYKQTWILKALKGIVTEEQIDFLLNDPKHKSMVALYMNDRRNVFGQSQHYRVKAIDLYNKISEHMGSTDSIPEIITYTVIDTTQLNEIVGHYKLKNKVGVGWPTYIDVAIDNGKLNTVGADGNSTEFYWHKDSIFYFGNMFLVFNKHEKGDLFLSFSTSGNATYFKKK